MNMFKKKYIRYSFILSITFWIIESSVHAYFLHDGAFTLIPAETNELWMRGLIVILIIGHGFFIQNSVENEGRLENEKIEIYTAMLKANNHILNNFLQNMYLFKLEADQSRDFDKSVLQQYNEIITDTKLAIRSLEGLENPSKTSIEKKYKPI